MTTTSGTPARLLVGIDGSPQSRAALDWAIGIARPLQAEVIAVYALPPPSPIDFGAGFAIPSEVDPAWEAEMRDLFESEWCSALDGTGLRFRKLMEPGKAAAVIAAVADRLGADLVVVGRRGRGEVAELLLGSVSHEVSHHCRRPVVLISMPAQQAAAMAPGAALATGVG